MARVAHLDELEAIHAAGVNWLPVRRELGITGFGVNAYGADRGGRLIEEHDETAWGCRTARRALCGSQRTRHLQGGRHRDRCAVRERWCSSRDPHRSVAATALADGTTALVVGGRAGTIRPSAWELLLRRAPRPPKPASQRTRVQNRGSWSVRLIRIDLIAALQTWPVLRRGRATATARSSTSEGIAGDPLHAQGGELHRLPWTQSAPPRWPQKRHWSSSSGAHDADGLRRLAGRSAALRRQRTRKQRCPTSLAFKNPLLLRPPADRSLVSDSGGVRICRGCNSR